MTAAIRLAESEAAIDVAPVPHFDHAHNEQRVFDCVYDPVVPLAHAIALATGKLLATTRSRIIGKPSDSFDDLPALTQRQGFDLPSGRLLDLDRIHAADALQLAVALQRHDEVTVGNARLGGTVFDGRNVLGVFDNRAANGSVDKIGDAAVCLDCLESQSTVQVGLQVHGGSTVVWHRNHLATSLTPWRYDVKTSPCRRVGQEATS
jgi:hypothetical protein